MIEHAWSLQKRSERTRQRIGPDLSGFATILKYRYVCSCGYATYWRQSLPRVRSARDNHALEGQLSIPIQ